MLRKLAFILLPFALFAEEARIHEFSPKAEAWVTGPIITPSAVVVQGGHYNIEPYIFATATTAVYDNDWNARDVPTFWNYSLQIPLQLGINDWLDFQATPILNWNYVDSNTAWTLGDLVAQFDFQLYLASLKNPSWMPSIRFTIKETFPIGKYRNLSPGALRADAGGFGAWVTTASLGASKIVDLGNHFFVWRANLNCAFCIGRVHVTGFNAYGGGFGTDQKIRISPAIEGQVGLEYTLTQNWVLACDAEVFWSGTDRSTGNPGREERNASQFLATNPLRANIQYSLAPAIEYNWSANLGLIAGVWFTVAGKNTPKFTSGVIALNYYK